MDAVDGTLALQHLQVAANGGDGSANRLGQGLNVGGAVGIEMAADGVETLKLQPSPLAHRIAPRS